MRDRLEKIARAEQLLKHPSQLKNKAQRFYLKSDGKDHYVLDTDKINNAAKYDSFLAIATNTKHIPPGQVFDHYHHLFQIEHSFRTFKSYLETRSMFHWTDKRIEGHICLCYLSYVLLNHLVQRLKKHKITEGQARKTFSRMQVSHIRQLNEGYIK